MALQGTGGGRAMQGGAGVWEGGGGYRRGDPPPAWQGWRSLGGGWPCAPTATPATAWAQVESSPEQT